MDTHNCSGLLFIAIEYIQTLNIKPLLVQSLYNVTTAADDFDNNVLILILTYVYSNTYRDEQ